MKTRPTLRSSEWFLAVYFTYVALLAPWFPLRRDLAPLPGLLAVGALLLLNLLAYAEVHSNAEVFSIARDWFPLFLTLIAYREMDWFTPRIRDYHLERAWAPWDHLVLNQWGGQRLIESLSWLIPSYLELCYLLVYAVGPFAVAAFYFAHRRDRVNQMLLVYLAGTLLSYALFPFFPSEPPRAVFPTADAPHVVIALRRLNLWLVGGYGIHSSVFPSAHVSSAFSAAWGLLLFLPEHRRIGWVMLIYAASVALATVYGRYHYAVDALAGLAVSSVALAFAFWIRKKDPAADER